MKMHKKKLLIIILLLILLIPFRVSYIKDGGSVEYKSFLYSVVKVHALTKSDNVYNVGWRVTVLGKVIYEKLSEKND